MPAVLLNCPLRELDAVLDPRTPLYLILRRRDRLVAITFVPYLAGEHERASLLEQRHELVRQLGKDDIALSMICKEVGEITDVRSWEEREGQQEEEPFDGRTDSQDESRQSDIKDLGYKKIKCRLCDRRMKNPILPNALAALQTLYAPGSSVQMVSRVSQCPTFLKKQTINHFSPRP